MTTCAGCTRELAQGLVLCATCGTTLDVALGNIAVYWNDLDTIREKRARYGTTATKGSVGKAQPLPVDGRFLDRIGDGSQLAWDTRNTVTTWARVVLEEHPPVTEQYPRDTIASLCGWLGAQRNWIVGQMWAGELLDEMLDLERRLRRMVDAPPELVYRGTCGSETDMPDGSTVVCQRALYATKGSMWVRCGDCGCEYDTEARKKNLLSEAEDHLATASEAADILTAWGEVDSMHRDQVVDQIRKAAEPTPDHPARLLRKGWVSKLGRQRPTYRLGDVADLILGPTQDTRSSVPNRKAG